MNRKINLILLLSLMAICSDAQPVKHATNYSEQKKSGGSTVNLSPPCPQPWMGFIEIAPQVPEAWWAWPMDTIGVYLPPWCGCDGEEFIYTFISPQTTTYWLYQVWDASPGGINIAIRPTDTTCSFDNFQLLYPDASGSFFRIYNLNLDSGASYDILVDNCCDWNGFADISFSIVIPPIKNINISNVKADSLTLSWDSIQGDVAVEYGTKDFTLGNGTKVLNPPNPFIISGLTPHTIYDFYVYQAIDTFKSCAIDRNRVTTAYICDSTPYIFCDNHYIDYYVDGNACKDAWTFNGCPYSSCSTANSNEFIFQFVPDSTGLHNLALLYDNIPGSWDYWSVYYKDASTGCNEQNWNFIQCGGSHAKWNADFGPLNSGQKYYLLFAGNQPSVSSCYYANYNIIGTFKLTCPSPLCSQPPSGLSSNANNNTICLGDSTQIFPVGSMLSLSGFYIWRKDSCSGSFISTKKNITVSPLNTTTYFLYITDSCGTLACDSITISVNPNPVLSLTNDTIICNYDSLQILVNKNVGDSVQWLFNGSIISGANDSIYYANQIGNYAVTVIDSSGCKRTSDSLSVLQSTPVADIIPANGVSICPGDTAQLSAIAIPGYTYQWFHDGSILTGATGNILNTPDSGYYYFSVVDTIGCAAQSDSISVNIFDLPQVSITPTGIINFYLPSFIIINAIADSSNTFQWFKNGIPITGAITSSYTATALGIYKVKVTDTSGCENYSQQLFLNSLSGMAMVDTNQQSKLSSQLLSDNKLITVTPNPANSITYVDLSLISGKHFDIGLKTIAGQTIFIYKNYKTNNLMIDVSQLNKGVYVLHITGDLNIFKKLIVN